MTCNVKTMIEITVAESCDGVLQGSPYLQVSTHIGFWAYS